MKRIIIIAILSIYTGSTAFAAEIKIVGNSTNERVANSAAKAVPVGLLNQEDNATAAGVNENENQLPVHGKKTFAKMFAGYQIKQAIVSNGNEGEVYLITAENKKESILVTINDQLEITICKSGKK